MSIFVLFFTTELSWKSEDGKGWKEVKDGYKFDKSYL